MLQISVKKFIAKSERFGLVLSPFFKHPILFDTEYLSSVLNAWFINFITGQGRQR
jgi:hypothetical protein